MYWERGGSEKAKRKGTVVSSLISGGLGFTLPGKADQQACPGCDFPEEWALAGRTQPAVPSIPVWVTGVIAGGAEMSKAGVSWVLRGLRG